MSKYLIDTNIIVDFWRGKLQIDNIKLFKDASVSVITICELFYGAEKSTDVIKSKRQINDFLADFKIQTINIDYDISEIYGRVRNSLEKRGERIEDLDLLIAATAILNDKILATGNIKHFKRIKELKLWTQ